MHVSAAAVAGRRHVLAWLVAVAVVVSTAARVSAHAGGHELPAGTTLHVWTTPDTGRDLPGSLLFVSNGAAHVEDLAGGVHVWPVAALRPADRAFVDAHLTRLARRAPSAPHAAQSVSPSAWLAVAFLATLMLWRARRHDAVPTPAMARMAAVGTALAAVYACGGSSSSATPTTPTATTPDNTTPTPAASLPLASYFTSFPSHVRTRQDAQTLYVESDGLADHVLMVGIRSWQQQVPLPADYTGSNAWTIPLSPRLADQPVSARTGLFRGAIALAVNGVPIFNALNNRGDDAFLAGELDDFGGHSGRADDYHYHTAPLFLSATVGATRPIAVALDGFPLYGALEPDGSTMRALDDYNGHSDGAGSYHYHGTRTYPYINGGMKGVVQVSDQVEPQPSVRPVRPAGTPLNGATITKHTATGTNAWSMEYQIAGRTSRVDYRIEGTRYTFVFTDPTGASRTETYTR